MVPERYGDFVIISVFLASAQSGAYSASEANLPSVAEPEPAGTSGRPTVSGRYVDVDSEANLPIVAEPEPAGTPGRPTVIGRYVDVEGGMKHEVQTAATHGR